MYLVSYYQLNLEGMVLSNIANLFLASQPCGESHQGVIKVAGHTLTETGTVSNELDAGKISEIEIALIRFHSY